MTIRVLVVDDSELARRIIRQELDKDPAIAVVGTARDALDASEQIETLEPDVLTLDMELPRMDGLTFLRSLMRHHPMPVVIVSAYTTKGSRLAMEALEAGAVDIVPKPGSATDVGEMAVELIAKVKAASQARLGNGTARAASATATAVREGAPPARAAGREATAPRPALRVGVAPAVGPAAQAAPLDVLSPLGREVPAERVIAIGSSTGGTQALQYILSRLPADMPPILIVQHMPQGFTTAFANRLNTLSALEVKEAQHNDTLLPGRVLVAPGSFHMVLRRTGSRYWVEITDGPRVCRQKPSVEVLFRSVAKVAGKWGVGAILTGMGGDGAEGMLAMKQAGGGTLAQDEASSVVFGMPREAIRAGGVDQVVHLHRIPEALHKLA